MHTIVFFTAMTLAVASPTTSYNNPVADPELAKYEVLINTAIEQTSDQFLPAKNGPITYEELEFYALYYCKNNKDPSASLIKKLIEIEKSFNPPPEMRGMLLAAACMESGFNSKAKGDRKLSRDKKTPMAIGILQLWPIYEKMYPGLDRTDPIGAAKAWMGHIVKKISKVKRQCRYKTKKRIWLAAWVTGIRYKKPGGRCNERPLHYRLLRKWHRNIKEDRQVMRECAPSDVCGC